VVEMEQVRAVRGRWDRSTWKSDSMGREVLGGEVVDPFDMKGVVAGGHPMRGARGCLRSSTSGVEGNRGGIWLGFRAW